MRGGTRLFFLAGDRVMQKLNSLYNVERSLTKSLRLNKIQVHFFATTQPEIMCSKLTIETLEQCVKYV